MKSLHFTLLTISALIILHSCKPSEEVSSSKEPAPFLWENATIYFMMTDRFNNGDPSNDFVHPDSAPPAPYRGFMGGDVVGITKKIKEGYFSDLGVDAIWMTPLVEQINGSVDEGTGTSYPFHGYWTRDWTAIDKRFGTNEEVKEMVQTAHKHGIRVLMDAVANHTGPVTEQSPVWPSDWVRTGPQCTYQGAESTISCTLVKNLPDILTDSEQEVELPAFLIEKWKTEGRYEKEVAELDEFFAKTGYKRTPVNYIIKWLVDLIKDYGIDGYRVDTVKHTESKVWADLYKAALEAYEMMKKDHPEMVIEENEFYMVGEVYNYFVGNGRLYDYNDKLVDFYKDGFKALINFDLRSSGGNSYESVFSRYDSILHRDLAGYSVVNYISSHDDGSPYDKMREQPLQSVTRLILTPGAVQMYYGDESARDLSVAADGDAVLRSFMNWDEIESGHTRNDNKVTDVLLHTQKLGRFRHDHPAIGAGRHSMISDSPYVFSRTLDKENFKDEVVIGLDLSDGMQSISIRDIFDDGAKLRDAYTGKEAVVADGKVTVEVTSGMVLLEKI